MRKEILDEVELAGIELNSLIGNLNTAILLYTAYKDKSIKCQYLKYGEKLLIKKV